MELNKKYYVYQLIDPRNNQTFYVGKGSGDRMYRHVWCIASESKKKQTNPIKNKVIKQLLEQKLQPEYKVEYFSTEEQAYQHEADLISELGFVKDGTGVLTNMQPGGTGPQQPRNKKPTYQFTKDGTFIQKYPSAEAAAGAVGVTGGLIRGACNSKIRLGMSAGGYLWSYENKFPGFKNNKERQICQYTMSGEYIQTFNTIRRAAQSINSNADPSNITNVCKGKARTAYGFVWAYEGQSPLVDKTMTYNNKKKAVNQFTHNHEIIATYQSVTDAAAATGVCITTVLDHCSGKTKNPRGKFYFRYEDNRWN